MTVLHVPFTYYPHACGGTEVYVAALCRFLEQAAVRSVVAAPSHQDACYDHEGIKVHRFAIHPNLTQDMMYGEGDPVAAAHFARVLDHEKPDLVHFHALTPAVSVLCLREAQRRGIPALCTYHTPATSCLRGTLMRWGTEPCDGEIRPTRCAACLLHAHGVPKPLAKIAALASHFTWPLALVPGLPNAARVLLRSTALVAKRRTATREWWAGAQCVIALCDWTRDLLVLNKVPPAHIRLVRHGLPTPAPGVFEERQSPRLPLKFAFFGRLDPLKGLDLLVQAMRLLPDLPITLDIYAITAAENDNATRELMAQVKNDARITLKSSLPASQVVPALRHYHALLVPSRCLETGPLVVLEAFAAGVPVMGSKLGGIAERVRVGIDGMLVPDVTPEAWRDTLQRLVTEPTLLARLQQGVRAPRTMKEVAEDMHKIYLQELSAQLV